MQCDIDENAKKKECAIAVVNQMYVLCGRPRIVAAGISDMHCFYCLVCGFCPRIIILL